MQSNISSMVQLSSIPGAIIAWWTSDRFGRIRSAQLTCILSIIGTIVWMTSIGNLGQLLAARFIVGLGVGGTVVCAPSYLTEIAPRSIRGAAVGVLSSSVYIGIVLGYFANYGVDLNFPVLSLDRIRIPTSLNIMFAGITLISSFFICESPRWLLRKGNDAEAVKALCWLRQLDEYHPFVREELEGMRENVAEEKAAVGHGWKWWMSWKMMFTSSSNLYVLMIVCGAQVLGQFSGGGSLSLYAPLLIEVVSGNTNSNTSLLTTAMFGVIKLVAGLVAGLFIVDLFGRKRAAIFGITLQTIASLYLTVYLKVFPPAIAAAANPSTFSAAQQAGGRAGIFFIYLSGVGWSAGFNSIQYLLGESYPLQVRSLGNGISMISHFLCQFGSSRSIQPIIAAWQPWGLFLFWFSISFACLFLVWFFIPETAGMPLEEIAVLFDKPWYRIGWTHNKVTRGKVHNAFEPSEVAYQGGDAAQPAMTVDKSDDQKKDGDISLATEEVARKA